MDCSRLTDYSLAIRIKMVKRSIRTISLFLLYSISSTTHAQVIDSIKLHLKAEPRLFFGFQNRNTFVNTQTIKLWGIVGGLDYDKKVKLYAGIYGFSGENVTLLINRPEFEQDSVYRSLNTGNLSAGIEYTYYQKGRLSLSAPVQVGIGGLNYHYTATKLSKREKYTIMPIEFGTNAYFNIIKYVGLKGGVGYRLILGNRVAAKYSAPYYTLGLSVSIGQIYKDFIQ
jgi:hypothetical protein